MTQRPAVSGAALDLAAANARVMQLKALADPLSLQVLSVAATRGAVQRDALDEALEASASDLAAAIEGLSAAGLLESRLDELSATPDALVRFGRILAADSRTAPPADPVARGALPPAIERVAADLGYRFSSTFAAETVHRYVGESYDLLRSRASISMHLPSLTARFAAERLGALATARGLVLAGTPEVLFVCVQNAGRSQIAAATLRHLAGTRVHVRTAGSAPASRVHSDIVDLLDEVGIPMAAEFPKPLTDEVVLAADVVVTMGCGDACPVLPGRRYLDWALDDPVGKDREQQRAIRDVIRSKVEGLLDELGVTPR